MSNKFTTCQIPLTNNLIKSPWGLTVIDDQPNILRDKSYITCTELWLSLLDPDKTFTQQFYADTPTPDCRLTTMQNPNQT